MSEGAAEFADAGSDVQVKLKVPKGASRDDLRVSGGADYLHVRSTDAAAPPLLSIQQLYGTIEPEHTRWDVTDGTLTVTLNKRDEAIPWPSLEAQEGQVALQPQSSQACLFGIANNEFCCTSVTGRYK